MSDMLTIGISDMKVVKSPNAMVTYALGSCVGICLYDSTTKIGGLGHIMLPRFPENKKGNENRLRFADSCIPIMVSEMEKLGCRKNRIQAKIAGGAKMFQISGDTGFGDIGLRNAAEVKNTLQKLNLRIVAEDTGANYGRTVYFYTDTGLMVVKSFVNGIKTF
jgi:chemotaxis protein CheD